MLFTIEGEPERLAHLLASSARARDGLSWLLRSHVDGHHLVDLSTKHFREIEQSQPEHTSRLARYVHRRRQDAHSLAAKGGFRAIVGLDPAAGYSWTVNQGALVVPLEELSNSYPAPAVLLAEDLTDAVFYRLLAEEWGKRALSRPFIVRLESQAGGGNNTNRSLRAHSDAGRVTVVVADSDRRHAGQTGMGETAERCFNELAHVVLPAELLVLHERMLENLLPAKLILAACSTQLPAGDFRFAAVEHLEKLGLLGVGSSGAFLSLKRKRVLASECDCPPARDYVIAATGFSPPANCLKGCPRGRKKCTCVLYEGIGDDAVDRVVRYLEHATDCNALDYFDLEVLPSHFTQLLDRLVAWGLCSAERLRI